MFNFMCGRNIIIMKYVRRHLYCHKLIKWPINLDRIQLRTNIYIVFVSILIFVFTPHITFTYIPQIKDLLTYYSYLLTFLSGTVNYEYLHKIVFFINRYCPRDDKTEFSIHVNIRKINSIRCFQSL